MKNAPIGSNDKGFIRHGGSSIDDCLGGANHVSTGDDRTGGFRVHQNACIGINPQIIQRLGLILRTTHAPLHSNMSAWV